MGKTKTLTIRLSPEDMALLKSYTAKTRLSQSAYLRTLIRGYVPKAYPPDVFFELMGKLESAERIRTPTHLKMYDGQKKMNLQ